MKYIKTFEQFINEGILNELSYSYIPLAQKIDAGEDVPKEKIKELKDYSKHLGTPSEWNNKKIKYLQDAEKDEYSDAREDKLKVILADNKYSELLSEYITVALSGNVKKAEKLHDAVEKANNIHSSMAINYDRKYKKKVKDAVSNEIASLER